MHKIALTQGKFAIVSNDDFERVSKFKWYATMNSRFGQEKWYAARDCYATGRRIKIYMHRFIMGNIPRELVVDHINANGLDNRRKNLSVKTHEENISRAKIGLRSKNLSLLDLL